MLSLRRRAKANTCRAAAGERKAMCVVRPCRAVQYELAEENGVKHRTVFINQGLTQITQ